MKVMVVAAHFPVSMARYLANGFDQAGHEVVTVGPALGRFIPWCGGMILPEEYVWNPTIPLSHKSETSITEALSMVGGADLIVHADTMFALTGDCRIPNVVYMADNHVRDYKMRDFDLLFGAHSWGHRHEENRFRWLPCAYDPNEHFDWWSATHSPRVVDVGFVGVLYENRQAVLNTLRSWGLGVLSATGKVYKESNDLYNVCKMALCVSACGDVPARVFENMAQGCVVLCDRQHDLAKLGIEDRKHVLMFSSPEELQTVINGVFSGDLQSITDEAKALVANHTWKARAEEIVFEVFH